MSHGQHATTKEESRKNDGLDLQVVSSTTLVTMALLISHNFYA
jgi:hypothetical protein